jgi:uncharacterized membrane protein YdcZ (DUF606 family)
MTRVWIPAIWYAQGHLPAICARHGGPATESTSRKIHTKTPPWIYVVMLASPLIGVIVAMCVRKTVPGRIPACARCRTERRNYVLSVIGGWVAAFAVLFAAAAMSSTPLVLIGILGLFAALIWSFCGDIRRVRGNATKDVTWIELHGVCPEFRQEVEQGVLRAGVPVPPDIGVHMGRPQVPVAAPSPPPLPAPVPAPVLAAPAPTPAQAPAPAAPPPVPVVPNPATTYPATRDILPGR